MRPFAPIALLLALLCSLHLPPAVAARSLVVTVYLHDELANLDESAVRADYFQHWLDEMRWFTNHPVELIFRRTVKGITDIDYAQLPSTEILQRFTEGVRHLPEAQPFSLMRKHVLLTRGVYDRSGLNYNAGLAAFKGITAIASLDTYSAPAHEIGHLLSATHEDAEIRFNGWMCETYTHPRSPVRSHCYRYSDANRANIVDYLRAHSGL
ncbi:hypothetical protein [Pseudomonas alabamensis]|uniref:hypothetical protein n=1 Tax=Pseudomonas alabamensis TaxID=3064349 RepID=UPI003F64C686